MNFQVSLVRFCCLTTTKNLISELGVEDALISSNGTDEDNLLDNDIVELSNGCVCCTVRLFPRFFITENRLIAIIHKETISLLH